MNSCVFGAFVLPSLVINWEALKLKEAVNRLNRNIRRLMVVMNCNNWLMDLRNVPAEV